MKFARLLFKNAWRNPRRTVLTLLSLMVALFVFCSMDTLVTTMSRLFLKESTTHARLIVRDKYGSPGMVQLPESYGAKLAALPHVKVVGPTNFFAASTGDSRRHPLQGSAVDPEVQFKIFADQMEDIPKEAKQAFLRERHALLIGKSAMLQYNLKVGQTTRMKFMWPAPKEVEFLVVGVGSHPKIANWAIMRRDYMESVTGRKGRVDMFWMLLDGHKALGDVARAVDAQFENSAAETRTETESQFMSTFMSFMEGLFLLVRGISIIVLVAITFVAANTVAMSVRERTVELAVMKAIGFTRRKLLALVLAESTLAAVLGGGLGCAAAYLLFRSMPTSWMGMMAMFLVTGDTVLRGLALSAGIGLASGAIPAWRASRLKVVDALRDVG